MSWYEFIPYVPVAERKKKAAKQVEKLKKKGKECYPIVIEGRTIANTFWGKAWCNHLESYSDYENRLPRGRTYVRNGAVIDLKIGKGEITALVSGSSIYKVKIAITQAKASKWNKIVKECAGKIDSLIELLQGKFSKAVMQIITSPEKGLFPHSNEIELNCSCPDWADMCKHVAAVLYGVGVRLDAKPEELFILRQVDHVELLSKAGNASFTQSSTDQSDKILDGSDLSSLFGIDIDDSSQKILTTPKQGKTLKEKRLIKKLVKPIKTQVKRQTKSKISNKITKKKVSRIIKDKKAATGAKKTIVSKASLK